MAIEVFQQQDGVYVGRVTDADGTTGPWLRLAAGRNMKMAEVVADLRKWHPAAVIRDVGAGPPEGDDAILWLR